MKIAACNVIVVRRWGAEHVVKGGYWLSWYASNVLSADPEAALTAARRYWKGDCLDAIVLPDREAATDCALSYTGPWRETVCGMAACIALGENPSDGGQRAPIDVEPQPVAPAGGITLDALVAP